MFDCQLSGAKQKEIDREENIYWCHSIEGPSGLPAIIELMIDNHKELEKTDEWQIS